MQPHPATHRDMQLGAHSQVSGKRGGGRHLLELERAQQGDPRGKVTLVVRQLRQEWRVCRWVQ